MRVVHIGTFIIMAPHCLIAMSETTFVGKEVRENIAFDAEENTVVMKNADPNETPLDEFEDALAVVAENNWAVTVGDLRISDSYSDTVSIDVTGGHGHRRTTVERLRGYIEEARNMPATEADELSAALKESGLPEDYFEVVETKDGGDPRHTHFIILKDNGCVTEGRILDALEGWEVNWVSTVTDTGASIYDAVEEHHVGRPELSVRKRE